MINKLDLDGNAVRGKPFKEDSHGSLTSGRWPVVK
jgi:hypothetical protein